MQVVEDVLHIYPNGWVNLVRDCGYDYGTAAVDVHKVLGVPAVHRRVSPKVFERMVRCVPEA